ncbi:hypothetical protein P59_195 [Bacillus phage P59]|nr:hypothetical protein P59_195 [Bacillus phage P59]
MELVVRELREQLIYAEDQDEEYAEELKRAIAILNPEEEEEMSKEFPIPENTMANLQSELNTDFAKHDADYLVLKVMNNESKDPEYIINPRSNFETKLQYLEKAYNDDLTLRNNPTIRIVEFHFFTKDQLKDFL